MAISKELSASLDSMAAAIDRAEKWLAKQPAAVEESVMVRPYGLPYSGDDAWFDLRYDRNLGLMKQLGFDAERIIEYDLPQEIFEEVEDYPVSIRNVPVLEREKYVAAIPNLIKQVLLANERLPSRLDGWTQQVNEALDAAEHQQAAA